MGTLYAVYLLNNNNNNNNNRAQVDFLSEITVI